MTQEIREFRCSHPGCPAHQRRVARRDRLREVEAAAQKVFDAAGQGEDALGDALVALGVVLANA